MHYDFVCALCMVFGSQFVYFFFRSFWFDGPMFAIQGRIFPLVRKSSNFQYYKTTLTTTTTKQKSHIKNEAWSTKCKSEVKKNTGFRFYYLHSKSIALSSRERIARETAALKNRQQQTVRYLFAYHARKVKQAS